MNDTFKIDTSGVDAEEVVAEVRRRVEAKRAAGVYGRRDPAAAALPQTAAPATGEEVLDYYLNHLPDAAEIDITDFEIESKTPFFGRPVVWLKKIIWKLLKFYTFRLFSQQKDYNARVAVVLQELDRRYSRRLEALEKKLESQSEPDRK